eukprot:1194723-Prorocentrum_minimum.AAC.1
MFRCTVLCRLSSEISIGTSYKVGFAATLRVLLQGSRTVADALGGWWAYCSTNQPTRGFVDQVVDLPQETVLNPESVTLEDPSKMLRISSPKTDEATEELQEKQQAAEPPAEPQPEPQPEPPAEPQAEPQPEPQPVPQAMPQAAPQVVLKPVVSPAPATAKELQQVTQPPSPPQPVIRITIVQVAR